MVRIPRIADVLDTTFLQENLQFLDSIIHRIFRLKTKRGNCLLAAYSIISCILKLHLRPFDLHVWKMAANLKRKVDNADILSVKIENAGMLGLQVVNYHLSSILYVQ